MQVPRWLLDLEDWRRRLTDELATLPATLTQLREGVDNFNRVTKRLVDATEGVEQWNALQGGIVKTLRDQAFAAGTEVSDTPSALAKLNPLWPRSQPGDNE